MMTVTVCVGSSCHLRGAREIIVRFDELLKQHDLTGQVLLKGAFCMERCGEGVNWMIDDEPLVSATEDDAVAVFSEKVLEPLGITPVEPQGEPSP